MQRKLVYSGGIGKCGGFAIFFDVLSALSLLGFGSAFNEGPHFHCVCAASLFLSLPAFFSSLILPTVPYPGGDLSFVSFDSSCPWPVPGAQSQVGPLPLFLLPCFALCSFFDSWRGFPGRDPVPLEAPLFPWQQTIQRGEGLGALWRLELLRNKTLAI